MPGGPRSATDRVLQELVQIRLRTGISRDIPLDELRHLSLGLSRRGFLRAAGGLGAGLVLSACTSGGSEMDAAASRSASAPAGSPRVVIVGAGLAGLTAAYRLSQAGVQAQVFEARDRVGGRCWSSREWDAGQIAEHGGETIDTRHVHIRGLIDEFGLRLEDTWQGYEPGTKTLRWAEGEVADAKELSAPMQQVSRQLARIAKKNGSYLAGEANEAAIEFDQLTETEWLRGETDLAMDSAAMQSVALTQSSWYGLDPEQLGASNLIDYYTVKYPGGDDRYTTRGGNDQIPQLLAAELADGAVTFEAPLQAVRQTSAGSYELQFDGVSGSVVADFLVLAIPFSVLRHVDLENAGFSSTKLAAINELGMGTNAKLLMQFDRPVEAFNNWNGYTLRMDDPMWSTWDAGGTDAGPGKLSHTLLTIYSGGSVGASYDVTEAHAMASPELVESTLDQLNEMVPGFGSAYSGNAWLDCWAKDPWVEGSYASLVPGNMTSYWGITGKAEGNAHFAGEHTSVYSQGFLNGGVESGGRAAAEILDALDTPYPRGLTKAIREQRQYEPVYPWA